MPPAIRLRELAPVPDDVPVHFRIPMGRDPDILLSIDGNGSYLWSLPDSPCERLATTSDSGVTSFGEGPLIFVEVDLDGCYFTRPALPVRTPLPTVQLVINAACAVLGRPSPLRDLPQSNDDFMSSPARPDIIADCLSSPCILTLHRWQWGMLFYIRADLDGSYHTYPHVGGPFQTLDEVYAAIECDLKQRQDPAFMTRQPGDTRVDYVVRQCLYWPDGKRKRRFNVDERRDRRRLLVQALVDKYNDYIGDLAYQLKDVVHYESVRVRDAYKVTYHINFTAKIKGTEDFDCRMDELFFAEVNSDTKTGECKFVVSCFCRIQPIDNGSCYGCKAVHPNAAVYSRGQAESCFPFGASNLILEDCDEDPVAEEKRLRIFYEKMGLNDPGNMEKERAIFSNVSVLDFERAISSNVSVLDWEVQDQAAGSSSRPTRERPLPVRLAGPEWQR